MSTERATKSPVVSEIKEEWDNAKSEKPEAEDLASVSQILDNASQQYQQFPNHYTSDEDGLFASSDCSAEKSDSFNSGSGSPTSRRKKKMMKRKKKKNSASAYSMAPNRVICPYCDRPFPWSSSLRRHILTHTGQKPYQCMFCHLLFTTKSNCDRHLLRKHKNSVMKMRDRTRSISSPEVQEPPIDVIVNSIPTVPNSPNMRNVPERPYKCNQCPSSTFSTVGNLKKHRSTKHPNNDLMIKIDEQKNSKTEVSRASSVEPQNSPQQEEFPQTEYAQEMKQECSSGPECGADCQDYQQSECQVKQQTDKSGYDSPSSGMSDNVEQSSTPLDISKANVSSSSANNTSQSTNESSRSRRTSPRLSPGLGISSDTPFKCHLCDSGFAERQDCLDHIKDIHKDSYDLLMTKGALDMDIDAIEDVGPHPNSQNPSDDGAPNEERRGRFPDYSNRKVLFSNNIH